ncbi:hypothetical protein FH972_024483 [Carpinus fangiana]|uniref:Thymidylate kinase n=1 Tax=Carpinus fangiana TaxID=176857 RepID=A0A5N6KYJ3_9ROSI|nr:hypothetical protein FH972_024483 [Carpinus fangiana]
MPARGKLIVLEGLDKAGKSSQCKQLAAKLAAQGLKVNAISFPDRTTPIGRMIDAYLKGDDQQDDHAIHLLFSANRWEVAAKIRADIDAGINVVIDRYYYSGCVYSAAKNSDSLGLAWARKPDEGLPRPDAVIFLGISQEEAAKRGGWGGEKYETKAIQDRVRELFVQLQSVEPEKQDFVRIDAGQDLEEVAEDVWEAVQKVFKRVDLHGEALRVVEPWSAESVKAAGGESRVVAGAVSKAAATPKNGFSTPEPAKAASGTLEKRSLKPQWGPDYETPSSDGRRIKIQGDGMGNRKTTEKNWWEYE